MKITQDVRKYAAEHGLEEEAAHCRRHAGEGRGVQGAGGEVVLRNGPLPELAWRVNRVLLARTERPSDALASGRHPSGAGPDAERESVIWGQSTR